MFSEHICCMMLTSAPTLPGLSTPQGALSDFAHTQGRVLLVIAHRIDTIMDCDALLVLNAGRLVEQGRPSELQARPGSLFGSMVAAAKAATAMLPAPAPPPPATSTSDAGAGAAPVPAQAPPAPVPGAAPVTTTPGVTAPAGPAVGAGLANAR